MSVIILLTESLQRVLAQQEVNLGKIALKIDLKKKNKTVKANYIIPFI